MQPVRRWARWVGAALIALAVVGCGDSVRVYPVHGKVTFEGKPLAGGGSIALVPLDNRRGKTAGAEIAEDGSYRLSTYAPGDGSMAGEFRVVIMQVVEREPEAAPDGSKAVRPVPAVPRADRIPAVYSDYQNSPLKATVEAKSANEINFDLKRDGHP